MTTLYCEGNANITSLDVRSCSALTELSCGGTNLKNLYINNELEILAVGGCSALTKLDCSHHQLARLTVSNCTALETLDCSYNALDGMYMGMPMGLTITGCQASLKELNCSNTNLDNLSMSNYTELVTLNVSGCTSLQTLTCANDLATTIDIRGCTRLQEASFTHDDTDTIISDSES